MGQDSRVVFWLLEYSRCGSVYGLGSMGRDLLQESSSAFKGGENAPPSCEVKGEGWEWLWTLVLIWMVPPLLSTWGVLHIFSLVVSSIYILKYNSYTSFLFVLHYVAFKSACWSLLLDLTHVTGWWILFKHSKRVTLKICHKMVVLGLGVENQCFPNCNVRATLPKIQLLIQ